jgi:hypothetical protein
LRLPHGLRVLLRVAGAHNTEDEMDRSQELADDLRHPIPRVHAYDTVLTFSGGGAYLGIVIPHPLDASSRSLLRLQEKQRFYLDSFHSEFGRQQWGTPKADKMKIYVSVHPGSSDPVFELLEKFAKAARDRGVYVIITKLGELIGYG